MYLSEYPAASCTTNCYYYCADKVLLAFWCAVCVGPLHSPQINTDVQHHSLLPIFYCVASCVDPREEQRA